MTDVENGNQDILKSDENDTMPVISITAFEKNRIKIDKVDISVSVPLYRVTK